MPEIGNLESHLQRGAQQGQHYAVLLARAPEKDTGSYLELERMLLISHLLVRDADPQVANTLCHIRSLARPCLIHLRLVILLDREPHLRGKNAQVSTHWPPNKFT